MSKPIVFQLEISGYQNCRIEDGNMMRPPTAQEVADNLNTELQFKFAELMGRNNGKMRVNIKRVS